MYVIVDIETTGSNSKWSGITEIAACLHDGKRILDTFHSHVNPKQDIPLHITRLTGITNEMVAKAPVFAEIADELLAFLEPHIFVAHNVSFDYTFIKAHFKNEGIQYDSKRLCTVRLARKILPGHSTYSLGTLCKTVGIDLEGRHTALGDASATAELFSMLVRNDHNDFIGESLKRNSKESSLPPHLDKKVLNDLPEKMGIYYFLNQKEEPIYIGKSKNIKSRIAGHLSTSSPTRENSRFINQIHNIKYELCPNSFVLDLLECHQIKNHWPKHNKEYKKRSQGYAIYAYTDQRGFVHFQLSKLLAKSKPIHVFTDYVAAFNYMKNKVEEFDLCPKLSGLTQHNSCSFNHQLDCQNNCPKQNNNAQYRANSQAALKSLGIEKESFAIICDGFTADENVVIWLHEGVYKGFGTVAKDVEIGADNISQ